MSKSIETRGEREGNGRTGPDGTHAPVDGDGAEVNDGRGAEEHVAAEPNVAHELPERPRRPERVGRVERHNEHADAHVGHRETNDQEVLHVLQRFVRENREDDEQVAADCGDREQHEGHGEHDGDGQRVLEVQVRERGRGARRGGVEGGGCRRSVVVGRAEREVRVGLGLGGYAGAEPLDQVLLAQAAAAVSLKGRPHGRRPRRSGRRLGRVGQHVAQVEVERRRAVGHR